MSTDFYAISSRSGHHASTVNLTSDGQPLLSKAEEAANSEVQSDSNNYLEKFFWVWIICALAAVGITLGFAFGLRGEETSSGLGAIVSSGPGCAGHGGQILRRGGSAVDAAIVTLLCDGIMLPHSLGLGGGFVATVYTKQTSKVEALIARETAPANATEDMFVGSKEITGAISAAVPSEIFGYWSLHQKYGKLPWRDLFQHAIDMCRHGFPVNKHLANVLVLYEDRILKEPTMAEIFVNPKTNELFKEGETMYRPKLANTLEILAQEGAESMYRGGNLGKSLVADIKEMGGIITEDDLQNYEVRWEEPVVTQFTGSHKLYTTPLPTSGPVLAFILNVMEPLYTRKHDVYWHRLIETFKHAYGHRTTLGDIHFEPSVHVAYSQLLSDEFAAQTRKLIRDDRTYNDMAYYGANFTNVEDNGTANLVVLAPNGDAIALTSSINSHFGAKVRSRSTGIILNDQMDDFSTPGHVNVYGIPASPANYIKPGKRPMSSMCPSMVLNKHGKLELMIGGAGGSKITTSVAQVILRYFALDESIGDSLGAGRIHHQLAPMHVDVEPSVPEHLVDHLLGVGHEINNLPGNKAYSALTAIGLKHSHGHVNPQPSADPRRQGSAIVIKLN